MIDSEFLAKTEFKDGELEIAGSRFHTLILPDVEPPKPIAEKIDSLRKNGFRVLVDQQDTITVPEIPKLEPANAKIVLGRFKREDYEILMLTNADVNDTYEGSWKNIAQTQGFVLDPQTGSQTPFDTTIRLAPLQTLIYVVR